jgi:hypothetical protein
MENNARLMYKVVIEETVCGKFCVEAGSLSEAAEVAAQKYRDCVFVLEPGNLLEAKAQVVATGSGNCSDWFGI